jgi:hypothetical protein
MSQSRTKIGRTFVLTATCPVAAQILLVIAMIAKKCNAAVIGKAVLGVRPTVSISRFGGHRVSASTVIVTVTACPYEI